MKTGLTIGFTGLSGAGKTTLLGGAYWDAVGLVEYPNKMALLTMAQSPEYEAIHHHREAGLEGQINLAVVQNAFPGQ